MRSRGLTYGGAALFWTVVGLFFTTQLYLLSGDWGDALQRAMPRWYVWGALTPLIIGLDRRVPHRAHLPRRLLSHAALSIGWMVVFIGIMLLVRRVLDGAFSPIDLTLFARNFFWDFLIYWFIVGVYFAFDYHQALQARELRSAQLEASLSEARLHALHAQLHPHFLFNALNAISAYLEKDPKTARRMTAQLGELLRASLVHADRQEITLAEELAVLDNYLAIELMRFEDQLTVDVDAPAGVRDALVPRFILQPLVENAVRHGITARTAPGRIEVMARREGDRLVLRVTDNGVGLPAGWHAERDAGIGLANTSARLKQLYNGRHAFRVAGREGGGVRAEITLPYRAS